MNDNKSKIKSQKSKMKFKIFSLIILFVVLMISVSYINKNKISSLQKSDKQNLTQQVLNPLSIQRMRQKSYPGSDLVIEEILSPGSNYSQYVASYKSDGLKIYGLLTVPNAPKPKQGYPAIIFNHGYIPPDQYVTTERYVAYVDSFARNGYIVFKPDYRGNGNSEGSPEGAYYSPAYATDVLNALASVRKYKDVDKNRIGMWGHSMGGNITLRDLVINTTDIKAAVIWGGVVGSYDDLLNNWQRKVTYQPSVREMALRVRGRQSLVNKYKTPKQNPVFWNSIDPTFFVKDITAPVQIDVGSEDEEVPSEFSKSLYDKLIKAGKSAELYIYLGSDHNISQGFNLAMQRSIDFFNKYLKGGE